MNLRGLYYGLTFVTALSFFVSSTYLPVWLEGISVSAVGPAISIYFVGQVFAVLLAVFVRVRSKLAPVALVASALSTLSLLTLNEQVIVVARFLGGMGAGLFDVIMIEFSILIARGSESSGKFYSIVNFLNAMPGVLGPLISAAVFGTLGVANIFVLTAGILLISSASTIPLLRLQAVDRRERPHISGMFHMLKKNSVIYLAYFLEMSLFMYWFVFVPLRMNRLGYASSIGVVFAIETVVYTLLQLANVKVLKFVKDKFWIFLVAYHALDVLITLVTSFWPLIVTFLLVAAVSFPLTPVLYTRNAEGTEEGLEQASSALMMLVLRLGWALGSFVAGAIFSLLV
jgi:MFS family permease